MEAITRLVAESLARHGLDRPVDPRRLQWSRWFRCDSSHSLLVVPSKAGIFAIAEEVMSDDASSRRMLAVVQFAEDDDMAFTLDRMFTRPNPMRDRLSSGRCFLRFVVVEDEAQRRSICNALNQWMLSSAEKASGLPADFMSSLEVTGERSGRLPSSTGFPATSGLTVGEVAAAAHLDSGSATNLHCPHPWPSGF